MNVRDGRDTFAGWLKSVRTLLNLYKRVTNKSIYEI